MLFLLRYLTGYVLFRISGSRPVSLVNELIRSGVNVWSVKSSGGEVTCCVSRRDYPFVQAICRERSQRVHIIKKHGVPFFLYRNRRRSGLAVGLILFFAIFGALSRYVWNIELCEFDSISETAAKDILRRIGFYEGAVNDFESLKRMQTSALLQFEDFSWITINADGSRGEVNVTLGDLPETNDTAPRNMKARMDGQIIRVDAYSGTPAVNAGDGVLEGELLISGVVENESGGSRLVHADGVALAKTRYIERFAIPKISAYAEVEKTPVKRYSCKLFSVIFPLTMQTADEGALCIHREMQAEFLGERASASIITESLYGCTVKEREINEKQADKRFQKERLLRELFKGGKRTVIDSSVIKSETEADYLYEVRYICEEDIASPAAIKVE